MADTMGTEAATSQSVSDNAVVEAADAFANAIMQSRAYREYEAASEVLQNDGEARDLFNEYQRRIQYVQMAAQWGGEREQDRAELARLEAQVNENAVISRYRESQNRLVEQLRELNEFTTGELGFDFAAMARPHGCGCS